MLDMRLIRENPDRVREAMRNRNMDLDGEIDELLAVDERRRTVSAEADERKAERNRASREIARLKKEGGDAAPLLKEMKALSASVREKDGERARLEARQDVLMHGIPNLPHPSVPVGKDDTENEEISRWGERTVFSRPPKAHWEIGADLGILDPETAAKVTAARFHFYRGLGCRLERSIISFFMDTHAANGYVEIFPPFIANRESMIGTGQLPKFAEDMIKVEGEDWYLIPTAEVPVTNMYRDRILDGGRLPLSFCAYSACFRGEAGSAGRDTRGLIRQHQFNKVELVKFSRPETSYEELESLTAEAEGCLRKLGLPYRKVLLSTGDMGFASAKTYDLEVWMPSYGRYVEISSCSNFEEFQARRAAIRFRDSPSDRTRFVHTLNGSGLAVGRTVAAVMENYQNPDGSVTVPEALRPYMGCDRIGKEDRIP